MRKGFTRREFLASTGAGVLAAGDVVRLNADTTSAGTTKAEFQRGAAPAAAQGGRLLLKGGCVLSLDPKVGDFDTADVLIDGSRIAAIGPNLTATATTIDASNTIVMPGFVDTHRHMWQGALRNSLPNGLIGDYSREILGLRGHMRPQDVRIGDLVSALGAIYAGVTTVLDW